MQTHAADWLVPVNKNLGPGPVNTSLGLGRVNRNCGPEPVNRNWGPGPVNKKTHCMFFMETNRSKIF